MIRTRQHPPVVEREMEALSQQIQAIQHPLEEPADLDPLLAAIGDARYVLLGEASHGTADYYLWRARLSQRLITEKGFSFIGVEGDWPDCYAINRYIKGYDHAGENAASVLRAFKRWPTWMWANWEIAAFAEWLRNLNRTRATSEQVGFYGLDVYSLHESLAAVIEYLQQNVPEAAETAKRATRCFEPFVDDNQSYAWHTAFTPQSCEKEVIELLGAVRQQARDFPADPEAAFNAEQNAWVAVEGERYYRTMLLGDAASWNIRDGHMADTLVRLMNYHGPTAKAIVWAHNTHIGDARATDMAEVGMFNIGELIRERHADAGVRLIGFGSYQGTVIAGQEWDEPMEQMTVPPAQKGSWEDVLHQSGAHDKLLLTADLDHDAIAARIRGHRAIGVVYHPDRERGNYVPTVLPERYDAFLYIDQSEALHPLQIEPETHEPPETYPWGL